jgi:hypothetical protein
MMEDVMVGSGHHVVDGAHPLTPFGVHGDPVVEHLVRDRKTLVHTGTRLWGLG